MPFIAFSPRRHVRAIGAARAGVIRNPDDGFRLGSRLTGRKSPSPCAQGEGWDEGLRRVVTVVIRNLYPAWVMARPAAGVAAFSSGQPAAVWRAR